MKLRLHTKMIPGYDELDLALERKRRKEEEEAEAAKKKKIAEMLAKIKSLGHFQRGGTAEFVIDLSNDLLELDQLHQVIVSFAQNGLKRPVQRELLYLNDGVVFDKKNRMLKDPTESLDRNGDFEWDWDSENGFTVMEAPHKNINPKFTFDRVLNHLVLRLGQEDTYKFDHTEITYDSEGYPQTGDSEHSLLTMEIKMQTEDEYGRDVITHIQRYYIYDSLFETDDYIYRKKRSNVYFGSYAGDGYHTTSESTVYDQLPQRIDLLKPEDYDEKDPAKGWHARVTNVDLCRDGLYYDFPQLFDSEGEELPRYACVAVPINMKVRLRQDGSIDFDDKEANSKLGGILVENGGHLNMWGSATFDSEGNVIPRVHPISTTLSYRSTYIVDPEGADEENPSGEFILWHTEPAYTGKYGLRFMFKELGK